MTYRALKEWSTRVETSHVTLRRLVGILVIAVLALAWTGAPKTAAALPGTSQAEDQFFTLLNQQRATVGLSALARDPGLDQVARSWSTQMDKDNLLHHRSDADLKAQFASVEPKWQRGGENVGTGGDVQQLHDAFVASPHHYENIVGDFNRVGVGVVIDGGRIWVTFNFLLGPPLPAGDAPAPAAASTVSSDLWIATANGEVHNFGRAPFDGDMRGTPLNRPIVGMAPTASGQGYWLVASDGGMFSFGDAGFYGSTGGYWIPPSITAMAATPSGHGYWLVATDGAVYAFGDAPMLGGMNGHPLNAPVNGIAATPSGRGYWLVAGDGGIFSFGDAAFYGSTGANARPIMGVASTPAGHGYWLVASDGTVSAFGDAQPYGSANAGGVPLSRIATTKDGAGYRMVASDGRIFSFGSAGSGATGPLNLGKPVVAVANYPD
ncbi:MAG: Esterase [Acidimicrobiia bacterium]|nr:Esterase [Acidimicrobiia bacterium]